MGVLLIASLGRPRPKTPAKAEQWTKVQNAKAPKRCTHTPVLLATRKLPNSWVRCWTATNNTHRVYVIAGGSLRTRPGINPGPTLLAGSTLPRLGARMSLPQQEGRRSPFFFLGLLGNNNNPAVHLVGPLS